MRADTFGYLQRCWPDASVVDKQEAREAGRVAAKAAAAGELDGSIALIRTPGNPYRCEFKRIELSDVAAKTKHMPKDFIQGHNDVSAAFLEYCRPLVGPLPVFDRF